MVLWKLCAAGLSRLTGVGTPEHAVVCTLDVPVAIAERQREERTVSLVSPESTVQWIACMWHGDFVKASAIVF